MKKNLFSPTAIFIALLFSVSAFTQNSAINGNVKNSETQENLSAATVIVKGSNLGTFTDDKGSFKLSGIKSFPATIVVSSVGFASQEVLVANASQAILISLLPAPALAQDVVVAASRTPERILESPVTIERVGATAIRNNPAASYYDIVGTLKGVDLVTSSLNFKTPTTRGFNTSGNLRVNQLVDGMDNQAPGLNFPVGAMVGLTELDVENMELLGGASSALYGAGGMNGTLLINGKNPFKYQGLSAQVKEGVMHIADDARNASAYNDITLRYAKAITEKFAFKIGGQYIFAKDWVAQNYTNFDRGTNPAKGTTKTSDRVSDENYNGMNVYGDETTTDIQPILTNLVQTTPILGIIPLQNVAPVYIPSAGVLGSYLQKPFNVSRNGYLESELVDPTTKNLRLSAALHYKLTATIEGSLSVNWGSGTTVYTGSDRYSLKDFKMAQYKAEVKHKNWFVRAYTTQEDAGKSFNTTVTTQLYNEAWKASAGTTGWYGQYINSLVQGSAAVYARAYLEAYSQGLNQGMSDNMARALAASVAPSAIPANQSALVHTARDSANRGMPAIGSDRFHHLFDSIASRSISSGGGLFIDKSSLYMVEGQYNFSGTIKVVEALLGANFKQYVLNSEGTIFADSADRIKINEVGIYALVSKKLFHDMLKLTASGRYDKSTNFTGRFTPRFSAVITPVKDHNIRLSFQTAYRFPSTQNQWIDLNVGGNVKLIGGLQQLKDFYHFNTNPVYTAESVQNYVTRLAQGDTVPGLLQKQTFGAYKPESATSYEVGYKTLINQKLLIDVYGYYTKYENFIGRITVVQSPDGTLEKLSPISGANAFSVSVNTAEKVNTQGWGLSAEYLLPKNFSINANVYSDEIKNVPAGFVTYYNTPKYRTNIGFSNSGFLHKKRMGFSIQYRYQDAYYTQADFVSGTTPAFFTFDAQVSYKLSSFKTLIKFGASNLTNHYYTTAAGNPSIGALYYASVAYNVF